MRRPLRFLPLLLLWAVVAAGASNQGLRPIAITRFVEYGPGGGVFLRADGKGRLHLLTAKSLTAARLSEGAPVAKSRLRLEARIPPRIVLDAAACSDGDWVILAADPGPTVRLFVSGEEKVIPQPEWVPTGVACPGGTPAVAVMPWKMRTGPPSALALEPPVLMLRWDGERWAPYVDRLLDLRGKATGLDFMRQSEAASKVVTAGDAHGRLWVGQAGFYNVRRITAAGRVDTTLESGAREVKLREVPGEERKRAESEFRRETGRPVALAPVLDRALVGLALGVDGSLYMLVAPRLANGKLAIDRYSPGEGRVMRIPLEGEASIHVASFVADASGIYWAERSGKAWWLPAEALEKAPWKPAAEVSVR